MGNAANNGQTTLPDISSKQGPRPGTLNDESGTISPSKGANAATQKNFFQAGNPNQTLSGNQAIG
jgi:hypothetical protein